MGQRCGVHVMNKLSGPTESSIPSSQSIAVDQPMRDREIVALKEALQEKTEELAHLSRRLDLLTRVANSLILGDDPDGYLTTAFNAVAAEVGAEFFFNYHIDESDPLTLRLRASGGLDPAQQRAFRQIKLGQFLCGRVAQSRSPLIVDDIQRNDDAATAGVKAMGIQAYAGFPLIAHGNLFGTIAFGSARQTRFSMADIEFMKTLADQFAATIERALLLRQLRDKETLYRSALTVGRMGAWETDYVAGTRQWSDEGMSLFGLSLVDGRGHVGGDNDEFKSALHPDDRHLASEFRKRANEEDSFEAEYRILRPDGTIIWVAGRGQVVARDADGKAQLLISIVGDITKRKSAEEHAQFLLAEISHRSKNLFAVVQAVARNSVRANSTMDDFQARFSQRLQGLATSHDLLVHAKWQGASLADLVRRQLAPFADVGSRLEMTGPDVAVKAEAAQAIGLALHELATNAGKYGALTEPTGKVLVSWNFVESTDGSRRIRLCWTEEGGPPVSPPRSKGFGHIVIERMVALSVNGDVDLQFTPQGLTWQLTFPAGRHVAEAP